MGRKVFETTSHSIKHLPSGKVAYLQEKDPEVGAIRGWFTDDLFMGTSVKAVKAFFRALHGGGRS